MTRDLALEQSWRVRIEECWLEESVDFSQSRANKLMRIFKEYGDDLLTSSNSDSNPNLNYSQAVLLLGIPKEERAQFILDMDIEGMTNQELRKEEALYWAIDDPRLYQELMDLLDYQYMKIDFVDKPLDKFENDYPLDLYCSYTFVDSGGSGKTYGTKEELFSILRQRCIRIIPSMRSYFIGSLRVERPRNR